MPNYSGIWTITQQMQTAGGPALWPGIRSPGDQIYEGSGGGGVSTYTWICPAGVTSVSVVCVGAGGGGDSTAVNSGNNNSARGAGGGGLGWKNNIAVTPGNSYTVQVGNNVAGGTGGTSFFISTGTVSGTGGQNSLAGGAGGTGTGDGGGTGGAGGTGVNPITTPTPNDVSTYIKFGGGGGAGGYTGNGGAGGQGFNEGGYGGNGGGGGGGWANDGYSLTYGYGSSSGGGVGLYGLSARGTGGGGGTLPWYANPQPTAGGGGSGGLGGVVAGADGNPYGASGGRYGGGACSGGLGGSYAVGGVGAVRIMWEGQAGTPPRSFPNNAPAWSLYAPSSPLITVNESVPTNGTTGLTLLFGGNVDEYFVLVSLPFNIQFLGLTYNRLFAGSNGYITFGYGRTSPAAAGFGNDPTYPHLGFFKGNKILLTVYGGVVDAGVYTLRWEGYNYGGSSSNRTIVEMRWFQNSNAHQVRYITNANGATNLELGNGSTTEPVANVSVSTLQGYDIIAVSTY